MLRNLDDRARDEGDAPLLKVLCCREHDLVGRYAACIHDHAFSADGPGQQIGFSLHLADVYVPELLHVDQKVSPSSLPHEQCVRLLQPFIAVAARSKQPTLLQRIKSAPPTAVIYGSGLAHVAQFSAS